MLNKFFKFEKRSTTFNTEILAGITTFVTMAYSLAVIPAMLSGTGMQPEAIFCALCISSGIVSIVMGMFVNIPIALAPGLAITAYFATIAAQGSGVSWQVALGAVFISGIIFFLIAACGLMKILIDAIPECIKQAITVGIGVFISFVGLKMVHTDKDVILMAIGLAITVCLIARRVNGAILIGIIATTLIGIPMGLTNVHNVSYFALPNLGNLGAGMFDIKGAFNAKMVSIIFTITYIGLMNGFGTFIAVLERAGLGDANGKLPYVNKTMMVSALGASLGSFFGVPTITPYLESIAGVAAGGKTGLVAVVVGVLFLLALFLSPIFKIVPTAAIAPALICVGTFMMSNIRKIQFENFTEALPAFLTIVIMPFTFNIADGISAGIASYILLQLVIGNWRKIHWMMYVLMVLISVRYVFFA